MNKVYIIRRRSFIILIVLVSSLNSFSQTTNPSDTIVYQTVKASGNYNKSSFYKFFWGEHYRKEWNTPVRIKSISLDSMRGGLHVYQLGGSRQTKSLRVRDAEQREYVFRSVDKSFGRAIPEITHGTFIESLANDQVTASHPYAALIVQPLAEAINIYHARPELVFVPAQKGLDSVGSNTGNTMYTFEQRPDENWATAANFGYSEKIVSTEKMLEKKREDNDHIVDQKAFVKARLFDILIGDWGRHEDQWRWATFTASGIRRYVPIPRDRDNAFSMFDGFALKFLIPAAKAKHLQTFDHTIKDVTTFNFPARNLDRHITNEVTREQWQTAAS